MQDILKEFGLSRNEIAVYLTLVEHGQLSAKRIAILAKVPRVRTYQTLETLSDKNLVSKREGSKITSFQAIHPEFLNSYITDKVKRLEQSKYSFEILLPLLISDYNHGLHRPSITFYEGTEGFRKIYNDILADGKSVYIIASSLKHPEYQKIIQEYKRKQEKAGITRFAIVSRDNKAVQPYLKPISGSKKLPDKNIKKVLREDLDLPGQVVIYGDKVAITNFTENVSHFVIENKSVSEMFRKIFSFMRQNYNKKLID